MAGRSFGKKLNTRIDQNHNHQAMLEHLEGRVLCSTSITDVDVGAVLAVAGQPVSISIEATSPNGVRAATIFRDVNENGRFDSGVDQALGDIFAPNAQGRFVRNIVPGSDWGRNVRLGVNAVDMAGQWSLTGARRVDLAVNQRPTLPAASVSASVLNERDLFSITVRAADDTSVRAVTAFVDRNGDGRWTGGSDISLGTSFVMNGAGDFVIQAAANPAWHVAGGSASIVVDAVDADGAWVQTPRVAGIVQVMPAPVIASFTAVWDSVQAGSALNPLKLTLTTTVGAPATAATFWLDLDGNGRWTAGTDFSLGDAHQMVNGSFILRVPSDLAGRDSVQIGASAVSASGLWAFSPAVASVSQLRTATITNFLVDINGSTIIVGAEAFYPPTNSVSAAQVSLVDVIADVNFNGVFDAGVDTLIASVAPSSVLSNGTWRHRAQLSVDQVASVPVGAFRWIASPRIAIGGGETIAGAGRSAVPHHFGIGDPVLTRITATIDGASNVESAAAGAAYSVEVAAFVASGTTALTMFWDANLNNRWDSDVDTHLAEYRPGTDAVSVNHTFSGVLPMRAGPGAFAAAALSETGLWSSVRSAPPINVTFIAAPGLISSHAEANSFAITLSAASLFGIQSFSGFLDLNDDGIEDSGEAVQLTAVRVGGSSRNGSWVLSFSTVGLPQGQVYHFRMRAIDAAGTASATLHVPLDTN